MLATRPLIQIPHSLRDVEADGAWRANLAWPVSQMQRGALAEAAIAALAEWRATLPEGAVAEAADLASLHLAALGARVAVHGNEIANAEAQGLALTRSDQDFLFLAGQADSPAPLRLPFDPSVSRFERALAPLRALRHARRWTPPARLGRAILAPDAHVISVAGLLYEAAANEPVALSYWAPNALLAEAQRQDARSGVDVEAVAEDWAHAFLRSVAVPEPVRSRAHLMLVKQGGDALRRAALTMAGLARVRRFPRNVWCGSAGGFSTRAVGLEVLRRGGRVRRFAHGGAIGLDAYGAVHAIVEMAATSDYVATSPGTRDLLRDSGIEQRFIRNRPTLHAGSGDPKFRAVSPRLGTRGGSRPTVLYVGTMFTGTLVHVPPVPPEAIYLDWQIRLVNALNTTGANVYCKPHPENLTLGGYQPLAKLFPVLDMPFERAIEQADILVHDYCLSTTFFEAMCSDRPIVLFDLAMTRWQPEIAAAVAERCQVMQVTYDERNRPQFDPGALKDAVLSPRRAIDPWPFRRLLAGEAPNEKHRHG